MCETCGCTPLARSKVYEFISAAFSYPDAALVDLLEGLLPDTRESLSHLEDRSSLEALEELSQAITWRTSEDLETEYVQTFGHTISKECPPYEAEYDQSHIFQKSQNLADIAGFYSAFGLQLSPDLNDRMDNLSVELEFMHVLCVKEAYALDKGHTVEQLTITRDAQTKFLREHLGRWSFAFVEKLQNMHGNNFYGLTGQMLKVFLAFDMHALGVEPVELISPDLMESSEEEMPDCEACPLAGAVDGGG